MQIYVAVLCDYNSGIHHGKWVDVTDVDTMNEEIAKILADFPTAKQTGCPAEEYALHDYDLEGIKIGEHESLETICELAEKYEEHDGAFVAWVNNRNNFENLDEFEEEYLGEWDSLADYVEEFLKDCGDLPTAPKGQWWHYANYIDFDRMGHDLKMSGDIWIEQSPKGIWVFSNS